MHPKTFISALDEKRLTDAIQAAEKKTTGQFRIFISSKPAPDPLATAQKHFTQLNMHNTQHRNAILLFIAPKSQTFAIIGDTAIHEKCGTPFWQSLTEEMTPHLKSAHYTEALLQALTKAADLLTTHFPATANQKDELPNDIAKD